MALTEEEFKSWLEHPVTREVRAILERKRDELRRGWEGGSFSDYTRDGTVLVNVGNLGTCKGYAFVSELDWEVFQGEMSDAK